MHLFLILEIFLSSKRVTVITIYSFVYTKQGALGPSPPLYFQRRHIRLTESMSAVLLIQTHFFKQIDSRHIPIHTYFNSIDIYWKLPISQ